MQFGRPGGDHSLRMSIRKNAAIAGADHSSRLANQKDTGCRIPGFQAFLPVPVEPSSRHAGQIIGRAAIAPHRKTGGQKPSERYKIPLEHSRLTEIVREPGYKKGTA